MTVISIILPVFDAAATVGEAIDSMLAQTEPDWELITVDDGSTDDSLRVLHAAARRDERIRVLAREHLGLVPTLNDGLAAARGRFVARMDARSPVKAGQQMDVLLDMSHMHTFDRQTQEALV